MEKDAFIKKIKDMDFLNKSDEDREIFSRDVILMSIKYPYTTIQHRVTDIEIIDSEVYFKDRSESSIGSKSISCYLNEIKDIWETNEPHRV